MNNYRYILNYLLLFHQLEYNTILQDTIHVIISLSHFKDHSLSNYSF